MKKMSQGVGWMFQRLWDKPLQKMWWSQQLLSIKQFCTYCRVSFGTETLIKRRSKMQDLAYEQQNLKLCFQNESWIRGSLKPDYHPAQEKIRGVRFQCRQLLTPGSRIIIRTQKATWRLRFNPLSGLIFDPWIWFVLMSHFK